MGFAYAAPKYAFIDTQFAVMQNVKAALGVILGNFIGAGFEIDGI